MLSVLSNQGLSHKNPVIRKGSAALLQVPRWLASRGAVDGDYAELPPVMANSVPKSGTHLLAQIVAGLPDRRNYGSFLSSMTSSFLFRQRSTESVQRFLRGRAPGEIIRAHLFFDVQYLEDLAAKNVVHYLIYRDPRDVVLSDAHYLRSMNWWHRLHRYFRDTESIDEAIELAIQGLQPPVSGIHFPNIGVRYRQYQVWISQENCHAVRFESLRSDALPTVVREMAEFYAARSARPTDVEACVRAMVSAIAPERSHTFRSGKKAGWKEAFSRRHRELFDEVAGDLLVELGYEQNADWVETADASLAT